MAATRPSLLTLLALLFLVSSAHGQQAIPKLDGYIDTLKAPNAFTVDGTPVEINAKTEQGCAWDTSFSYSGSMPVLSLGDHLLVYGNLDHKAGAVRAAHICIKPWT